MVSGRVNSKNMALGDDLIMLYKISVEVESMNY
jgi:hypothetical protein